MSGIREEPLKTDKHNVKVSLFRGGTIENMEDNIKHILKKKRIVLSFISEPTMQQI